MTLGAITILLGRPLPSSHVLHVVYLNTIVFTYHVKHVIVLLPYFREKLQTQVEHLHHKAWPSDKAACITSRCNNDSGVCFKMPSLGDHRTRPPSVHHSDSHFRKLKDGTRCTSYARKVMQNTKFQINGNCKAAFRKSVPMHTNPKAFQGFDAASLKVTIQRVLLKPPDPQHYDQTRMTSNSGNTVPWQCLFTLFFGQIHASTFCVMIALDALPLLLGYPWQSVRRVLPEGYLNTAVFTYHGERVTFSSSSLSRTLQAQVKHVRLEHVDTSTDASTSPRCPYKKRAVFNKTKSSRSSTRSSTRQDVAYKEAATQDSTTGTYMGITVPIHRLPRENITKPIPPEVPTTTGQPFRGFRAPLNWVPGAYLPQQGCHRFVFDTGDLAWAYLHVEESTSQQQQHLTPRGEEQFRGCKAIEEIDDHIELPRIHGVQVLHNVASWHEYEELLFNKGEAGTLHSQVGEGDATLPSRKTAFFHDRLASSTEHAINEMLISFGSEIAISSNFLHPSMRSRSSSETWPPPLNAFHAFFSRDVRQHHQRVLSEDPPNNLENAFYLNRLRSSALKSINDEIFGIECTIHFELDHDLVIKCILILAFIS